MVSALCTSSDDPLYLYKVCTKFHENISKGFLVIAQTRNHDGRTDEKMDRQTDGQTDRQGDYYRALPTSSGGALKEFCKIIQHYCAN